MFLTEYRAKEILAQFGIAVPDGGIAGSREDAERVARGLSGAKFAVKAQIFAGGRGEAGGVKMAATPGTVADEAAEMLGSKLVTAQTGPDGEVVSKVYIEKAVEAETHLYCAVVVDEQRAAPVLLLSADGGMEFERDVARRPESLQTIALDADGNFEASAVEAALEQIQAPENARDAVMSFARKLAQTFMQTDALLIEVNPLAVLPEGSVVALDAKMVLDGNALHRHPEFERLAAENQRDATEAIASDNEINFVRMSGNIGVVVNGAGLALATNDMVCDAGGAPANFMDIRTTASSFQIARGIQLLLEDEGVKSVLVNIHGGGMTVCDTAAEALGFALSRASRKVPIVFRVAGQNAEWANTIVRDRRFACEQVSDLNAAVARAVELANEGKR